MSYVHTKIKISIVKNHCNQDTENSYSPYVVVNTVVRNKVQEYRSVLGTSRHQVFTSFLHHVCYHKPFFKAFFFGGEGPSMVKREAGTCWLFLNPIHFPHSPHSIKCY